MCWVSREVAVTCRDCDGAGCPECRVPQYRSGTPWSEADYRAHGYHQLKVRLPLDAIHLLDCLAETVSEQLEQREGIERTVSRGELLDTIIRYMVEVEQREPGEVAAAVSLQGRDDG